MIIKKILKILKHPKFILLKLDQRNIIRLSDRLFVKLAYEYQCEQKIDLDNPKTFNEKIQWLKLYDRKPEYTKMVDKYEVKKYVSDIIGEQYVIPTLGIYNKFEDINFNELPNQFVLKCTHDSGGIVICKDKNEFDIKEARKRINKSLKRNYYKIWREWPYKNVKRRILAEKYMVDESGTELKDYKIFCFNGKAKYIQVDFDRFDAHKRNIYDINWNLTNMRTIYPMDKNKKIEKPKKLELMLELANELAKDKKFVRIDFYSIIQNIFFGEITFYPGAGLEEFIPKEYNKKLGDLIELR